jgi:hypothetical protein
MIMSNLMPQRAGNTAPMTESLASRPQLPANEVTKRRPGFQFPVTLLTPLMQFRTKLLQQGYFGGIPMQQLLVICGFPRSGTTLCQLMLEGCTADVGSAGRERRALQVGRCGSRRNRHFVSKRPKDLFLIPEIASWYEAHGIRVQFLVMHRDPRSILTSRHFSAPTQYYFSPALWTRYRPHWNWACQRADVMSLSYEQLVRDPDSCQQAILEFTGWTAAHPFSQFHRQVRDGSDQRALNGLRPVESSRINAWRATEHSRRIGEILSEIPDLPQLLMEDGFEADASWAEPWLNGAACGPLPEEAAA